jgi:hypothetical protein
MGQQLTKVRAEVVPQTVPRSKGLQEEKASFITILCSIAPFVRSRSWSTRLFCNNRGTRAADARGVGDSQVRPPAALISGFPLRRRLAFENGRRSRKAGRTVLYVQGDNDAVCTEQQETYREQDQSPGPRMLRQYHAYIPVQDNGCEGQTDDDPLHPLLQITPPMTHDF